MPRYNADEVVEALEYLKDGFEDDEMMDEAETLEGAIELVDKYDYELDFEAGQTEENHE